MIANHHSHGNRGVNVVPWPPTEEVARWHLQMSHGYEDDDLDKVDAYRALHKIDHEEVIT